MIKKISIIFALFLALFLGAIASFAYNNVIVYKVPSNTHKLKVSVKEKNTKDERIYILSVKPDTIITVRPIK